MSYTIVVYYTYDRVAFIMRTEERDDEACRNSRTRIKLAEYNFSREFRRCFRSVIIIVAKIAY